MSGPLTLVRGAIAAGPPGRLGRLGPRRRFAVNAFAGQILFAIVTFAAAVFAARLLGPGGKGELTAWTLVSGFGGLLLAGSIPTGFARLYLDGEAKDVPRSSLRHAALALSVLIVLTVPAVLLGIDLLGAVCFILVGVTAAVVIEDVVTVMIAAKRPWAVALTRTARSLVLAAGLGIGLLTGASLGLAFGLWAAGSLLSMVVALFVARHLSGGEPMGLARSWGLGRGSATSRVSTAAVRRLDQLIVGAIAGLPALGLYNAAVNLSEVTEYAGAAIGHASFESERTLDDDAARRILRFSFGLLATVSCLLYTSPSPRDRS